MTQATLRRSVGVVVRDLRVEHLQGFPLSIPTPAPRLSWRTETDRASWLQSAWEIEAESDDGSVWASGRVDDGRSILLSWGGAPLRSRARVRWRVRVWGADGSQSPWSDFARFEVGLLSPHDWSAAAIAPAWADDSSAPRPASVLRRRFVLSRRVLRARLHATALGIYTASLNGRPVGDHELAPGWTSYAHRMHVQTFDVTDLLQVGQNDLTATVADGWWRGALGPLAKRDNFGDKTGFVGQLEIALDDGTTLVVATDEQWEATTGPVRAGDLYDGETYDARIEPGPWSTVRSVPLDRSRLTPQATPPVRVTEVVAPVRIITSTSGHPIVDFGQNLVGVVQLRVQGPAGTTITLRHAEVLENGELCTRLLRTAKATDQYVLRGGGLETWRPTTTFHGFRYVEVQGWPGKLHVEDLDALVLHTDLVRTGWFSCSNELVNQLHRNIMWGWRGNTVSLPTDCPQRDERLGWTGDLQVFARTALFLSDAAGFLDGWLADLAAEQLPDGRVPAVVPALPGGQPTAAAGWGDVATVLPDLMHRWYDDDDLLRRQFPSMRAWVDSITAVAGEARLWTQGFQYGDWVDPTVDPRTPAAARTDAGYVATAYYYRSARLVAGAAETLGLTEVAVLYAQLADEILRAFQHEYVSPGGRVVADTQTGCALALMFGLVDERHRHVVGARLRELVRNEGHRLSTGFLGTPVLAPALTAVGFVADAYQCLLNEQPPGWLYPVVQGGTTVWEHWEALRPDGSLNPSSEMLSFNHYAFGAVGEWLHATVGGLSPTSPGFRRFRAAPLPGSGITSAELLFDSRYGRIEIRWVVQGRGIDLEVVVPPNTTADVVPPGLDGAAYRVGSGRHRWRYGVTEEVYRQWVDYRFGARTTIESLAADPAAWAVVQEVAPQLSALLTSYGLAPLGALGGTAFASVVTPLLERLAALDETPDEPERIWPAE